MTRTIVLQWQPSSLFGWGVFGLNLALNWASDDELFPVFSGAVNPAEIAIDRLRSHALEPVLAASQQLAAQLQKATGQTVATTWPVIDALGNGLVAGRSVHDTRLTGRPAIAAAFVEDTKFEPDALARTRAYDLIAAGSTWNARLLAGAGLTQATAITQGVDPTLFHPAPQARPLGDRFLVFSGGKIEHRKGQDLVLLAFKAFAERHPEAMLVAAWHSPWPQLARSVEVNTRIAPVAFAPDGRIDARGWAAANGIDPARVIDLGAVPNAQIAPILREMDAAVFPNRAEGGTNLVAMECMACAVPAIVSANTGHLDLIRDGACMSLARQAPLPGPAPFVAGTEGWGESDVDEIVAALETVFADRAGAAETGRRGAALMAGWSWANQARLLKDAIRPLLRQPP